VRSIGRVAGGAVGICEVGAQSKLSDIKAALKKVHALVSPLPRGNPGKWGSPQRGDSQKGYRLDPAHPNRPSGHPESKPHINWWDWSDGGRRKGGRSGAEPIG